MEPGRPISSDAAEAARSVAAVAEPGTASAVVLTRGQNAPLPTEVARLRVAVTWDQEEDVEVDASALLLAADGRVRSDDDLVFYNQPASPDGTVQYLGQTGTDTGVQAGLALDLEGMADDVTRVAVTASLGSGTFGALGGLRMQVGNMVYDATIRSRLDKLRREVARAA